MKKTLLFLSLLTMGVAFAQGTPAAKLSGVPVSGTGSGAIILQSGNVLLHRATNAISLLDVTKPEYTRVPLGQVVQTVYSAAVSNNDADPITAQVRIRIFDPAMTEIATDISASEVLAANTTSAQLSVAPVFNPTAQGTYTFTYDAVVDGTPDPASSVSYTVEYTNSLMARDNDTPVGSLGIGAGNGGYLGQTFTFSEAGTLASVSIFHMDNSSGNGDIEMGCAVFKMVAGVPQLVYTADSQQIADGSVANWVNYAVNPPLAIEPGDTLLVCGQEFAKTIQIGLAAEIFTPGTTYVNWPTTPFGTWAHNEDFGSQFAKPYMIRLNLGCTLPDPTVAAAQERCEGATVDDLDATGTGIEWFEDAVGGTALAGNTLLTTHTYYVSQHDGTCYSDRIAVDVTVNAVTSNTSTVVTCDNYTWAENGVTYTDSGVYNVVTGCHTETLDLTINQSTVNTIQTVECGSYTWAANDETYTESGFYAIVIGCHTEVLELTITPMTTNTTVIDACDSYTWAENGTTYTDSGTYNVVTDCHTETLELTITPTTSNTTAVEACGSYMWAENGVTYTDSGTYDIVNGCHTETLELTITPPTSNTTAVEACGSYMWAENGVTYTDSGTYDVVTDCHTETLELTIMPPTSNTTAVEACDSYMWEANGVVYTESGSYNVVDGCHTETLDLTITPAPYVTSQPVDADVTEGNGVAFSVVAENVGNYQWQASINGGQDWLDIPEGDGATGTNTDTLQINGAVITTEANGAMFRVRVTNGNCEAYSTGATLTVFLGIDPIETNSIVLYPNPTQGAVHVATTAATAVVTVFDINGRLVLTQQLGSGNGDIDLSGVQAGVYLFTVTTEDGIMHKKVVKQ